MMLVTELQKNRGNSERVKENETIPANFDSANYNDLTSLFFVSTPTIPNGLICPPIGDEVKALTSLYVDKRYIPSKQYRTPDMRDWSILEKDSNICTDIILTDQYLFAQSDIHYQHNAYNLICSLCKKSIGVKVNVVIFTLPTYKDETDPNKPVLFNVIERQLKQQIAFITGIEPYVTFVKLPVREAHDRKIFTNYKSFSSGDSFKYFEEKRDGIHFVSNGTDLYSNTHIDRDNHKNAQLFIEDLQTIIDTRVAGINPIIGDRKSNFLHFS